MTIYVGWVYLVIRFKGKGDIFMLYLETDHFCFVPEAFEMQWVWNSINNTRGGGYENWGPSCKAAIMYASIPQTIYAIMYASDLHMGN